MLKIGILPKDKGIAQQQYHIYRGNYNEVDEVV